MSPEGRGAFAAIAASLLLSSVALAQPAEPDPERLRAQAHAALAEGRIEQAYGLMRAAAECEAAASDWREVAEIAGILRLDRVALAAYGAYLERAPQAEDRAAVEGRVRVLRHLAAGAHYALDDGGRSVRELVDWDGQPIAAGPPGSVLVDWQGRPQARHTELLSLAEWDGTVRGPAAPIAAVRTPRGDGVGFGRALSAP
ncbi:MAG: hypothetical protein H6719_31785 [Sandaracinaceae bacterium]|nr:hypothetical protein [Sandaracinaceae bacterium]